jgi:hypothetical protein
MCTFCGCVSHAHKYFCAGLARSFSSEKNSPKRICGSEFTLFLDFALHNNSDVRSYLLDQSSVPLMHDLALLTRIKLIHICPDPESQAYTKHEMAE